MSDLALDNLRDFTIADRGLINGFLVKQEQAISEYNFTNLFCWGPSYGIRWTTWRDWLIIYDPSEDLVYMPVGKPCGIESLLEISDAFRRQGKSGNFFMIPPACVEKGRADLEKIFDLLPREDLADYVYLTKKLFELKGSKLAKKKNLISQFVRRYPDYSCSLIGEDLCPECRELAERWYAENLASADETSKIEMVALDRAFRHFRELELEGLALTAGGKTAAFTVFDRLTTNTALVHFEKSDLAAKGAAQVINWETARYFLDKCEFINREQDMGIEGLRQAKRSYAPEKIVIPYQLIRKNG